MARLHCMHKVQRCSLLLPMFHGLRGVSLSVEYNHELCEKARTDWDDVLDVDSGGPKESCMRWRPDHAMGNFGQPLRRVLLSKFFHHLLFFGVTWALLVCLSVCLEVDRRRLLYPCHCYMYHSCNHDFSIKNDISDLTCSHHDGWLASITWCSAEFSCPPVLSRMSLTFRLSPTV